jgi:hypothetical protein
MERAPVNFSGEAAGVEFIDDNGGGPGFACESPLRKNLANEGAEGRHASRSTRTA